MHLWFLFTEMPTVPRNVVVSATGGESINITWMHPQNFGQFDIDHYDINVTSTSGVQNMTTACGECTNTTVTVNNVQMTTNYTVTIAAVNLCGETGPTGSASYTLGKL